MNGNQDEQRLRGGTNHVERAALAVVPVQQAASSAPMFGIMLRNLSPADRPQDFIQADFLFDHLLLSLLLDPVGSGYRLGFDPGEYRLKSWFSSLGGNQTLPWSSFFPPSNARSRGKPSGIPARETRSRSSSRPSRQSSLSFSRLARICSPMARAS